MAGKYRIERELGRGGMGVVVAAQHTKLAQPVAIKFVTAKASEEILKRFEREGRAAAKLKSEHVARIHDIGELEDGTPYMVMEYLRGEDLAHVVKAVGALPPALAIGYLLQACEALAEAHAAGIVHRDLKPANLFLTTTADGSPIIKVLDFGISKDTSVKDAAADAASAEEEDDDLTKTSMLLGTPHYMSPEQMMSARTVDARADIWSLGAILYQLLTGERPFPAKSLAEIVALVMSSDPPAPSVKHPEVTPEVDAIIARCLQKAADDRFANVAALAEALAPFGPDGSPDAALRCARLLSRTSESSPRPLSRISLFPTSPSSASGVDAPSQPSSQSRGSVAIPMPALAGAGAQTAHSRSQPSISSSSSSLPSAVVARASSTLRSALPEGAAGARAGEGRARGKAEASADSSVDDPDPSASAVAADEGREPSLDSKSASGTDRGDTAIAVTATAAPLSRQAPKGSLGRWVVVGAVGCGVAAAAAITLFAHNSRPPEPAATSPAAGETDAKGHLVPSAELPAAAVDSSTQGKAAQGQAADSAASSSGKPRQSKAAAAGEGEAPPPPDLVNPPEPSAKTAPSKATPTAEPAPTPPPQTTALPPVPAPSKPPPPAQPSAKKNPLDMEIK